MKTIHRVNLETAIAAGLRRSPAVALLGPRQRGKTTLARKFDAGTKSEYFDLEKPQDVSRLANPELTLLPLRGLIVIDEVQRRPDLFPVLRTLLDRRPIRARFLLLGRASPELLAQSLQSQLRAFGKRARLRLASISLLPDRLQTKFTNAPSLPDTPS